MGKKKANGEGSITKRKDGRYMGRYTVESKRRAVYGDSFEESCKQKSIAEVKKVPQNLHS